MLTLATFQVDCTPPPGLVRGLGAPFTETRDPLFLRGYVLDDGDTRCLVASLDYCGLLNQAQDDFVDALAAAVDAPSDHVALHCGHQHDAPLVTFGVEPYLGPQAWPAAWWRDMIGCCAEAASACRTAARPVGAVGRSETRVSGYASNRRILGPDGKIRWTRWSRCGDPEAKAAPVGTIDPMLRTLAFRDDRGETIGSMSFYATHPQVANTGKAYSADAPGEAMRLVSERTGAGLHAFLTGPGGNVTAGKYSDRTDPEGNLLRFGGRLADAIGLNLQAMTWESPQTLTWSRKTFPFPARDLDREAMLAEIADTDVEDGAKRAKGILLACQDHAPNQDYPMSLLTLGEARVLFLSGEPFVEHQIYAQSLIPDQFLAVAANGSDSFLYLPLARSFAEGGYEPTMFCWCDERFEPLYQEAVAELLAG